MWNIERLDVYLRSVSLIKKVYVVIERLPKEERFELGSQLRRAVVSVKSNMIEGSGKRTSKEFLSYLNNAMGSLKETRGQVEIAVDLGFVGNDGRKIIEGVRRIERMLMGYMKYVKNKDVK